MSIDVPQMFSGRKVDFLRVLEVQRKLFLEGVPIGFNLTGQIEKSGQLGDLNRRINVWACV
jgi:hypothetical protein